MNWSEDYQITPKFRKPSAKNANYHNQSQTQSKYYQTLLCHPQQQQPKLKNVTIETHLLHSKDRKGSRPKLEYLRFEKQKLDKQKNPNKSLTRNQRHSIFRMEKHQTQLWKYKKEPPEIQSNTSLFVHEDYQMRNIYQNNQIPKLLYCPSKQKLSKQQPSNKFFQITFSLGSTEPEQSQKQETRTRNSTLFHHHLKYQQVEKKQLKQRHAQIPNFRRKRIQKQILSKEQQYRCLIRSSSKQCGRLKTQLTQKMKKVLDQLFTLKKQLPN